jgi:hypothetical protein
LQSTQRRKGLKPKALAYCAFPVALLRLRLHLTDVLDDKLMADDYGDILPYRNNTRANRNNTNPLRQAMRRGNRVGMGERVPCSRCGASE